MCGEISQLVRLEPGQRLGVGIVEREQRFAKRFGLRNLDRRKRLKFRFAHRREYQ